MNKRIFFMALLCITFISNSCLHAIEQVNTERIEQHKRQIKSRISTIRITRVAAAVGLIGAGVYMFANSAPQESTVLPLTPQENNLVRLMLADKLTKGHYLSGNSGNTGWLSWGASLVKSGLYSGVNLLSLLTLNVIGSEMIPFVQSGVSALLRYPGSAFRFYTIHARIPEILKEYTYYAEVLNQEQMNDVEDMEYALLYFLNEYDEIVYRVEKLLAYIEIEGEKDFDLQEDSQVLVQQITRKTDQLSRSLYRCGAGNTKINIVEMIKNFETELTTAIRLCAKSF